MYLGERLTAAQARKRAELVAYSIATQEEQEYHAADNRTVREVCDIMLSGKLGRVSIATYNNARTAYAQFLAFLGRRADEPIRLITRADIRAFVDARRFVTRRNTVHKAMTIIRAAFTISCSLLIIVSSP